MRALILEQGYARGALAAARALASDGWTVGSGTPVAHPPADYSRAVARHHRMPPASAGGSALVAAVNRAIQEGGYEVVFSCDDIGVFLLSQHRSELHGIFPYGSHSGLVRTLDKLDLVHEARRAGLAVPHTLQADTPELDGFGDGKIVIKPRFTFVEGVEGRVGARVVSGVASAITSAETMRQDGAEPLIQEHLEGRLMAFTALTDRDARIVAQVQQVADITWPVSAGVSARAHTVAIDEELAAGIARLLEALGWFGLASLQFILCEDDVPRLLDFNGRFYGSLALGVAAGPNLPAVWARMATGRPVGAVPRARPGTRYEWLVGDLLASWTTASGLARVTAVLRGLLRGIGATHSIWRASDPWPAIAYYLSPKSIRWMLRN